MIIFFVSAALCSTDFSIRPRADGALKSSLTCPKIGAKQQLNQVLHGLPNILGRKATKTCTSCGNICLIYIQVSSDIRLFNEYVLLKEKNMLLTIQQESKRQCVQMPSPERIKKVNRSMQRLDGVVKEREDALRLLQTGQEKGRPGEWRRNVFGKMFWYRFREHPVPWYMNKIYKRKRFYTPLFVAPYTRISLEKHLRSKMRRERKEKQNQKKLSVMFSKKTAQI
ncbi:hypothetical protein P4O66_009770 [Electrophorus voltai]|uniref:Large ribosomal subunit protein uL29m n=1 Tax=Electrophorus voltai TaxID=2609070 RepID=A0AAD8ZCC9_9TELE|nr:hypothetical protein P4O66_009770 [Electrophorus voltai]